MGLKAVLTLHPVCSTLPCCVALWLPGTYALDEGRSNDWHVGASCIWLIVAVEEMAG